MAPQSQYTEGHRVLRGGGDDQINVANATGHSISFHRLLRVFIPFPKDPFNGIIVRCYRTLAQYGSRGLLLLPEFSFNTCSLSNPPPDERRPFRERSSRARAKPGPILPKRHTNTMPLALDGGGLGRVGTVACPTDSTRLDSTRAIDGAGPALSSPALRTFDMVDPNFGTEQGGTSQGHTDCRKTCSLLGRHIIFALRRFPSGPHGKKKSHQTSAAVLSDLGYSLGVISLRLRSVRVYASPRIEEPIPSIMITIAESTRGPGLGGARRGQKEEGDHKKRLFLFSL